jgi:hypothetical protein
MTTRDRIALAVVLTFTALSVILATASGGPYDPTVAVLTATLIAIIWYTFFTFQAVHREPATWVSFDLEQRPNGTRGLEHHLVVTNPTDRVVWIRPMLQAWTDGELVMDHPLGVRVEEGRFPLGPRESFEMRPFMPQTNAKYDPATGKTGPPDFTELLVALYLEWKDESGRTGTTLKKFWHRGTGHPSLEGIVSQSRIEALQRPPETAERGALDP